jgi:hypothetical protein
MGMASSRHKRRKMHTKFWKDNITERDHYEDLDVDGSIILKRISMK